jgi:DNA-binding LytR/AlgR family response regulator
VLFWGDFMKLIIGVCDDQEVQVDTIVNFLQTNLPEHQLQLIKAYSGEELLQKLENQGPDVVFLDIEMKDLNGLMTGKKIREKYPNAIIIFITGFKSFALDAFKIKSMDYLIKPVTEKRMKILLKDLKIRLMQIQSYEEKNQTICFRFRDNTLRLKYSQIFFFEKNLRKITVFSEKGKFEFYESMEQLRGRLDMDLFIRCHNSYIVNKSKIQELKNDSIYIKEFDKTLPVSRKNKLSVKEIFENNLFS